MGVKSEIRTLTPTYYLDFTVDPGAEFSQPITAGWTTFAYTLEGNLKFGKYINALNGLGNKDIKISNDQKICKLLVILDNAYRYHQFARILNT